MVYSMLGVMQLGFGAAIIEAAPVYAQNSQQIIQLDNRQEHDNRKKQENERHEQEMRRRPNENEQEWRRRQNAENERHNNELQAIEALIAGIVIGTVIN